MKIITRIILGVIIISLISCSNFGTRVKKGNIEVFYKKGITTDQAEKTADLLYASVKGTEGEKGTKSMQLLKGKADTIIFRMVVNKEKIASFDDDQFRAIAYLLSDKVFGGNPVNVDLTDKEFVDLRSIPFLKNSHMDSTSASQ